MSTLKPARPLMLVTIGHPGAGKSFFARQFADTFRAPLISFDEIRHELFNEISHSSDEDIIVARGAGLQLRELLKTKRTILIDGGHNPKISRIELAKLAREAGYSVLYVWVQTDEPGEVEVLGCATRTFEVSGHHYALVEVSGLVPDTAAE